MTKETFKKVLKILANFKETPFPSQLYAAMIDNEFSDEDATKILNMNLMEFLQTYTLSDFLEFLKDE
jgi:hypothetical protein